MYNIIIMSNIKSFALYNNGLCKTVTITDDIYGIWKGLKIPEDTGYFEEIDIIIGKRKYHMYLDCLRYTKKDSKIVCKANDNVLYLGNILFTKMDKNGKLFTMSSNDINTLREHLIVTKPKQYNIYGKIYYTNPIILKI